MPVEANVAIAFVEWIVGSAIASARGEGMNELTVAPATRFWLGRVAPEAKVMHSAIGERAERLDPCAVGMRFRPSAVDDRSITCTTSFVCWRRVHEPVPGGPLWLKTEPIIATASVTTPRAVGAPQIGGQAEIAKALAEHGLDALSAEFRAELESGRDGEYFAITILNTSPEQYPDIDTNLYEVSVTVTPGETKPFILDSLKESFRYDRRVDAYGINGGVERLADGRLQTMDYVVGDQARPTYWDSDVAGGSPDLTLAGLDEDPLPRVSQLVDAAEKWTKQCWGVDELNRRATDEAWTASMVAHASDEAAKAYTELERLRQGIEVLKADERILRAFRLANRAFSRSPAIPRDFSWRPFQLAFVLANLDTLGTAKDRDIVDTLWFPTGGGKTETYLLFTLIAAFFDRLRGKRSGITSWGRFPLRMLSLQQTQRFADVLCGAELVRRDEGIRGAPFSIGFLVGQDGTPNEIKSKPAKASDPDVNDPDMPELYRVLVRCPFCMSESIRMTFDRQRWALDHQCDAAECPWKGQPLPFRVVDDEIYRWLPTVVLGTLDKAASVAWQAAMRGFYAAPYGLCPDGHGYTYAARGDSPTGCLYPGCKAKPNPLGQGEALFPPTIRMQDELHLLRDSLGAIDSHYEAILDHLQDLAGTTAKIIASSATLAGHEHQVEALYRREGRTFPLPGPRAGYSFWGQSSSELARRYVGVAPRGVTLEYVNEQLVDTLQRAVRQALEQPVEVARTVGIPVEAIPELVSMYGVNVIYGSTLKDVDAAARSFESQSQLEHVNVASLTGRTPLKDVRDTMRRLSKPEPDFNDRVHIVAASSMLSHGVDIDRLNVMVMLGLPLATAEFIQTTARVGRSYPGVVFLLHKIGRERDAGVFRMFRPFVEHADRLIDPVPITAKSRRILELTFPGVEASRILAVHEPEALKRRLRQLTTIKALRDAFLQLPVPEDDEAAKMIALLDMEGALDDGLRGDIREYFRRFYRELNNLATTATWPSDLYPSGGPMRSLRDVEEQVTVVSVRRSDAD